MTWLSRRLFGAALVAVTTASAAPPTISRRRVGCFEVSFLLDGWIDFPCALFTGIAPDALGRAARGLHPAHPGIGILFEHDRAAADASRARFFDQAASEDAPLAATHMPFPGGGRIMRIGGGPAWLPADCDYAA